MRRNVKGGGISREELVKGGKMFRERKYLAKGMSSEQE